MLTSRDDEIRRVDWPERMQLAPRPGGPPQDPEMEARWIIDRMMGMGSVRDLPTFGGDLLLNGWADDESERGSRGACSTASTSGRRRAPQPGRRRGGHRGPTEDDARGRAGVGVHRAERQGPHLAALRGRREDSRPPPRGSPSGGARTPRAPPRRAARGDGLGQALRADDHPQEGDEQEDSVRGGGTLGDASARITRIWGRGRRRSASSATTPTRTRRSTTSRRSSRCDSTNS